MPTGYKKADGTDLESVFAPYTSGTKAAVTGYKNSAGTDLSDLFAPVSAGSPAAATGFKISGGTDLGNVFAAAGSIASVSISDQTISNSSTGTATAAYYLRSSGQAQKSRDVGSTLMNISGEWLVAGSASQFEARATLQSGSNPTSGNSLGVWHPLSADVFWGVSRGTLGTTSSTLLVEIRLASSGAVLDSATITLEATRDSA